MGADDPRNSNPHQSLPLNVGTLWVLTLSPDGPPWAKSPVWYHLTLGITQPTLPSSLHNWTYLEKKKTFAPLNTIFELLGLDCLTSCARVNFGSPISSAPPAPVFHPACHGSNTSTSSFQVSFYDEKCTEGVLIKTSCCALYYLVWWSLYC